MLRYGDIWDVNTVLQYLEGLGSNDFGDKELNHKLAMLLALATACRALEIQGMHLESMQDFDTRTEFFLPQLTK